MTNWVSTFLGKDKFKWININDGWATNHCQPKSKNIGENAKNGYETKAKI
jgi:hypothetical protein